MGKRVDPLVCGRPAGSVCDLDCANCDLGPIRHLADHGMVYVHSRADAEEIKAVATGGLRSADCPPDRGGVGPDDAEDAGVLRGMGAMNDLTPLEALEIVRYQAAPREVRERLTPYVERHLEHGDCTLGMAMWLAFQAGATLRDEITRHEVLEVR